MSAFILIVKILVNAVEGCYVGVAGLSSVQNLSNRKIIISLQRIGLIV